jgi:hypothetical protein
MLPTPSWLYYLFAVALLALAGYALWLLVVSARQRTMAGRDVEVSHAFMGVAMAGMFVPSWAFGASAAWEIIFAVLLIWFVVRSIQSVQRFGVHLPHFAIHGVMSFGMLLMYWFPAVSSSGAMSMSMSAHSHRIDPGLALLVTAILYASAIFTIASPNRGATHFGTHGRVTPDRVRAARGGVVEATTPLQTVSYAERVGADTAHVVMCIAMGLMLILMI